MLVSCEKMRSTPDANLLVDNLWITYPLTKWRSCGILYQWQRKPPLNLATSAGMMPCS